MERDDIWRAIDAQRIRLTDQLAGLTAEEWQQPSLVTSWTIRDVGAHLTMQQTGLSQLPMLLTAMVRARGNLDRAIHDAACRAAAAMATGEIIARIRAMVGSQRHNLGVTYRETLIDILVHSQDILLPLGRSAGLDPAAAAEAANRVWSTRYFRARQKLKGFRLTATDVDWSAGEGQDVRGPIDALLLLLTGRSAALPHLDGAGATALTHRLADNRR